jgi:hypothetical protein
MSHPKENRFVLFVLQDTSLKGRLFIPGPLGEVLSRARYSARRENKSTELACAI